MFFYFPPIPPSIGVDAVLKAILKAVSILVFSCALIGPANIQAMDPEKVIVDRSKLEVHNSTHVKSLGCTEDEFVVNEDGQQIKVNSYDVDEQLQNLDLHKLALLAANDKIALSRMQNGDYSVKLRGQLKGGGPVTGAFVYWGVKAAAYAGLTSAAVTSVAAGGPAMAAAGTYLGATLAGGATAGASTAGALAGSALAGEIATGATAIVASGGGPAMVIASIETTAATAGAAATLCPFLP